MQTNTDWLIQIVPKGEILELRTDYTGEVPTMNAYTELLSALSDWAEKYCEKELRIFSFPKMMRGE